MSTNILVIGSNSYSGSCTVKSLLDDDYKVFGISRSPEVPYCYRPYSNDNAKFKFYALGSNFNPQKVVELCDSEDIRYVLNFASQSMVAQSWLSPEDWYQTNCVWLSSLVSCLKSWGKVERFIQFSTPEVYGSTSGWIAESNRFNPSTPYAISRAAGDQHLFAMHKTMNFPVIFTRAANIYGPFQPRYRLIPKLILNVLTGKKLELHGGGASQRSFIFEEDVSSAVLKILRQGKIGETYHISTQSAVPIIDVVKKVTNLMQVSFQDFVEVADELPGKDSAYLLDSSKIRRELGWRDVTSLEEGVLKTINWAKDNLEELLNQPSEYHHRS